MVLFDRSWYNRSNVEWVMGFCTEDEHQEFLRSCPEFERMLVRSGIVVLKYWFSVSVEEQQRRFEARNAEPLKRWKLSDMDLAERELYVGTRWPRTRPSSTPTSSRRPGTSSPSDDKRAARLNCISHLLDQFDSEDVAPARVELPEVQGRPVRPAAMREQTFVPQLFLRALARLGPWRAACTSPRWRASPASRRWPSASSSSSPGGWSGWRSSGPSSVEATTATPDYVLDLLVSHDAVQLTYDECAGVTYAEVHHDPEAALDRIVDRYHQVAEKGDAVVVVGSDYTDVGAPTEFSFNARVAANLGARCCWCSTPTGAASTSAHGSRDGGRPSSPPTTARCSPIVANRVDPAATETDARRRSTRRRAGVRPARAAAAERAVGGRPDGGLRRHAWSAATRGCWRRR